MKQQLKLNDSIIEKELSKIDLELLKPMVYVLNNYDGCPTVCQSSKGNLIIDFKTNDSKYIENRLEEECLFYDKRKYKIKNNFNFKDIRAVEHKIVILLTEKELKRKFSK